MSWDVSLVDTDAEHYCSFGREDWTPEYNGDEQCPSPCYPTVEVPRHEDGGTYALGGTTEADLNVTYNYSKHYYRVLGLPEGFRSLNNMTAAEALPYLEKGVAELGTERSSDYWEPTEGNAGYALSILLGWAKLYPKAVFHML